jgi:hypothetical protein
MLLRQKVFLSHLVCHNDFILIDLLKDPSDFNLV